MAAGRPRAPMSSDQTAKSRTDRSMLARAWHDPVWSKIIVAAIIGAFGLAYSEFQGWISVSASVGEWLTGESILPTPYLVLGANFSKYQLVLKSPGRSSHTPRLRNLVPRFLLNSVFMTGSWSFLRTDLAWSIVRRDRMPCPNDLSICRVARTAKLN